MNPHDLELVIRFFGSIALILLLAPIAYKLLDHWLS